MESLGKIKQFDYRETFKKKLYYNGDAGRFYTNIIRNTITHQKSKLFLYQQDAKPIEKMMKLNFQHMPPNSMLLQYLVETPPSPVPTMLLQGTV